MTETRPGGGPGTSLCSHWCLCQRSLQHLLSGLVFLLASHLRWPPRAGGGASASHLITAWEACGHSHPLPCISSMGLLWVVRPVLSGKGQLCPWVLNLIAPAKSLFQVREVSYSQVPGNRVGTFSAHSPMLTVDTHRLKTGINSLSSCLYLFKGSAFGYL